MLRVFLEVCASTLAANLIGLTFLATGAAMFTVSLEVGAVFITTGVG